MSVRIAGIPHRRLAAALVLALLLTRPSNVASAQDTEILTNESVIQMTVGKLNRDLIVRKIVSARPGFDLSSGGLIALTNAKIDEKVIKQMLTIAADAQKAGTAPPELSGLDEILTNDAIMRMIKADVKKPIILSKMESSRSQYDVKSTALVALTAAKVPQDIINLMMTPVTPPTPVKAEPVSNIPIREPGKSGTATSPNGGRSNGLNGGGGTVPKTEGPNSVAIYPLSAGGLPTASRYTIESNPIHASVSMRVAQAFINSGQWEVSNRSADKALQNELERSRSIGSFKSPVIVKDNVQTNARFAVIGLLDQVAVRVGQGTDKNRCPTYNVTLHFTAEFGDVQSGLSLSSRSFTATFPSTNTETLKQVATAKASHQLTRMTEKCKETQDDALDYALTDVGNQAAVWAKAVYLKRPAK